ncbi:hypothetical protein DFH94DRAFT_359125 [Russula ochroleuca]|uniref:DUF6535 domain-containing protein n=1 Tax=Russula ochroleuca TaxID=152965 RepID=A0A9P5MQ66_9AGAM|nr:hypothetical protein DFH94DRAFT_359125 [Russula ochroleuca]
MADPALVNNNNNHSDASRNGVIAPSLTPTAAEQDMKLMEDPAPVNNKDPHIPAQGDMCKRCNCCNDSGASRNFVIASSLTPTTADSGKEIWDMYLDEVKEDDKRMAEAWKVDSGGIITLNGLFSATVGAFIIEFYKQLSPSSGNQTVTLLPNGTYSVTTNPPSPATASLIWVNAMWLISLVLSLTSALIATLLQEWARRYVEMPERTSDPNHRARVRSFLFLGTKIYKMRLAVQLPPALLHLSVFLFFAGLVIVFRMINKTVAIAVEVAVGVFGVAYVVLSILPCLNVQCPYRTPMSYFLWYPTHIILSFFAVFLRWVVEQLHDFLVKPGLGDPTTPTQQRLVRWLESREISVKTHWRYFKDGIGRSIINCAINTQGGDRRIVTRLFNLLSMGDKSKLRKFAASIPRENVPDLIPRIESKKIVLQEPLRILLQSCAAGTSVVGLDEEVRRSSLLVCLDAIHNIVKEHSVPDLNYVRANYANISLMRAWLDSSDIDIRLTSRSICALLAKQIVREEWLEQPQLFWLQEVTGSRAAYGTSADTWNRINLKSFVYGVLSNRVGDLRIEDIASFKETLAILLGVENDANFDTNFRARLSEVEWIQQGSDDVVHELRTMFLPANPLPPRAPP